MNWEPWTGCYQASDGCSNCYFYGPYAKHYGQNTIQKTDKFDWPVRKNKKGEYNIKGDKILATCFATDFFLPEADEWRKEAWVMIKEICLSLGSGPVALNEIRKVLEALSGTGDAQIQEFDEEDSEEIKKKKELQKYLQDML